MESPHRGVNTQRPQHTEESTDRVVNTQRRHHTEASTHRGVNTQRCHYTEASPNRGVTTQRRHHIRPHHITVSLHISPPHTLLSQTPSPRTPSLHRRFTTSRTSSHLCFTIHTAPSLTHPHLHTPTPIHTHTHTFPRTAFHYIHLHHTLTHNSFGMVGVFFISPQKIQLRAQACSRPFTIIKATSPTEPTGSCLYSLHLLPSVPAAQLTS